MEAWFGVCLPAVPAIHTPSKVPHRTICHAPIGHGRPHADLKCKQIEHWKWNFANPTGSYYRRDILTHDLNIQTETGVAISVNEASVGSSPSSSGNRRAKMPPSPPQRKRSLLGYHQILLDMAMFQCQNWRKKGWRTQRVKKQNPCVAWCGRNQKVQSVTRCHSTAYSIVTIVTLSNGSICLDSQSCRIPRKSQCSASSLLDSGNKYSYIEY